MRPPGVTISLPSSLRRLTAIEHVPRFTSAAIAEIPPTRTPTQRPMSPRPGGSTLITEAP
jgi:hypothetical protein